MSLTKNKFFSLFLLIFIASFFCNFLQAIEIRLQSPHKIYSDQASIYIDAEGSSTLISSDTLLTLKYNIPITITYYIELHQKKFLGLSTKRANLKIVNRITYDLWSDSYIVEKSGVQQRFFTLETLEQAIVTLEKVPVIRTAAIDPEKEYFIKSRVVLKIKNYASYYDFLNNLLSIFKYRTTYYTSPLYSGAEMLLPASP